MFIWAPARCTAASGRGRTLPSVPLTVKLLVAAMCQLRLCECRTEAPVQRPVLLLAVAQQHRPVSRPKPRRYKLMRVPQFAIFTAASFVPSRPRANAPATQTLVNHYLRLCSAVQCSLRFWSVAHLFRLPPSFIYINIYLYFFTGRS